MQNISLHKLYEMKQVWWWVCGSNIALMALLLHEQQKWLFQCFFKKIVQHFNLIYCICGVCVIFILKKKKIIQNTYESLRAVKKAE